jgi:hypothetical protein
MRHLKNYIFQQKKKNLGIRWREKLTRSQKKIQNENRTMRKYFAGIFVAAFSSGDGFLLSAHPPETHPFVE